MNDHLSSRPAGKSGPKITIMIRGTGTGSLQVYHPEMISPPAFDSPAGGGSGLRVRRASSESDGRRPGDARASVRAVQSEELFGDGARAALAAPGRALIQFQLLCCGAMEFRVIRVVALRAAGGRHWASGTRRRGGGSQAASVPRNLKQSQSP